MADLETQARGKGVTPTQPPRQHQLRVRYVAYFMILHCVLITSVQYTHSNPNYVLVIRDAYVRDFTRAARVIQK